MADKFCYAEYIWLDGAMPTQQLRSKTRILPCQSTDSISLKSFPEWVYDGSSTYQAEGKTSDLVLKPVSFISDTIRDDDSYLVMCEVFENDGKTPHITNTRAQLRAALDAGGKNKEFWFGLEQEYVFFQGNSPIGWPEDGFPAPQGPYYCSVGTKTAFGREIAEEHMEACVDAGIQIYGINAEVMPGQWEFQIGYRGDPTESSDALTVCDQVWLARFMLHRIAEAYDVSVSLDNKPVKGDWNGSGMHTNVSTKETRDPKTGMSAIEQAINLLSKKHKEHIAVYGANLGERLTGLHETCDIDTFRSGVSHRGASIRIPLSVSLAGCGYLEDRRPGANANPYDVATMLIKTICQLD